MTIVNSSNSSTQRLFPFTGCGYTHAMPTEHSTCPIRTVHLYSMYVCTYGVCTCTNIHMYVYTNTNYSIQGVHMYVCAYICMYACITDQITCSTYIRTYVHTYVCIRMYTIMTTVWPFPISTVYCVCSSLLYSSSARGRSRRLRK